MKRETEPFRVASVLPLQPGYAYAQGFETVDGWANLYPKVYREYWLRVLEPLFKNVPGSKQIFNPDTGRPQDHYIFLGADLIHPDFGALPGEVPSVALNEGFDVEQRFNLRLLGLLNVKYLLSELPLKGQGIKLVHAPATPPKIARSRDWATGWVSDPPSKPHGKDRLEKIKNTFADLRDTIRLKSQGKDVYIYSVDSFVPRFRFIEELRIEKGGREVLDVMSAQTGDEIKRIAYADASVFPDSQSRRFGVGSARISALRSSEVALALDAPQGGFLAIGVTWSPYWRAEIDGRQVKVARINHAQMGVEVEAGSQSILLRYSPPYLPF